MENHFDNVNDEDRVLQPGSEEINLPGGLEEKILNHLKERGMIVPSRPWFRRTWLKVAAAVFVVAGAFTGGYLSGKSFPSSLYGSTSTREYLLLLYNPADFASGPDQAKEYGTWMHSINNAEVSASGEELKDYGWILERNNVVSTEARPVSGEFGSLSGFFLLNASSPERMLEIAASCPHLKYNGVIELRPILPH